MKGVINMSIKSSVQSSRFKKRVVSFLTAACCSASMLGVLPSNSLNKAFDKSVSVSYAANINTSKCLGVKGFKFTINKRYTTASNINIVFQSDGNLVIYNGTTALWSSGTCNSGATSCVFQNDGNLVMYNSAGKAVWATRSANKGGNLLYLDYNSGELYIYSSNKTVIWTSKNSRGERIAVTSGSSSSSSNTSVLGGISQAVSNVTSGSSSLSSCAKTGHSMGSWTTTKQPTCTATGAKVRYCTKSGCTYSETGTIAKLGHSMKYNKTVKPTCTAQGYELHKCTRCTSTTKKNYKAAAGHSYQNKQTAKAETCTTDGLKIQACSKCSSTRNVTIKANGHNYKYNKTVKPTCTAKGYDLYKCTRSGCGVTTKKNYKAATGHNYKYNKTVKATCTTNGYKLYKCTGSGCKSTKKVTIKATGHKYGDWKCVSSNKDVCTRECSACKNVETTSHTFNGSYTILTHATCKTTGERASKCTNCGGILNKTTIPKTGHKYKPNSDYSALTCIYCEVVYPVSRSTTFKQYVNASGIIFDKLSESEQEKFMRGYLIAVLGDSVLVDISIEMANQNKVLEKSDMNKLKSKLEELQKLAENTELEDIKYLSDVLRYGTIACDVHELLNGPEITIDNAKDSLSSFIDVASSLFEYIPYYGKSYSEVIKGFEEYFMGHYNNVRGKINELTEATLILNGVKHYTDLADPVVYENQIENLNGASYKYRKAQVDYYIYSCLDKDIKAITGMSIDEICEMIS